MLNFANLQKITGQMRKDSSDYVEGFFQRMFDSLEHQGDGLLTAEHYEYPDHFKPEEIDPMDIFPEACFELEYTFYGELRIKIDNINEKGENFRLISEFLLANGFNQDQDYKKYFVHPNINEAF